MKFLAIAAGLIASVSAYSYPTSFDPTANGASPSGDAIYTPATSSPVTLGVPYDITWDPTTPGPIALVLCQGPSTNCVPILTIADKVTNSGSFTWTPTDLDPSATSTGGYGIMLIDYTSETYQYSMQFGLLAGTTTTTSSSTTSATSASVAPSGASTTTVVILPSSSAVIQSSSSAVSSSVSSSVLSTVTAQYVSTTVVCPESAKTSVPLGTGTASIPWVTSTGSPSVPTSVPSTVPSAPVYTGAADRNMISYGAVGAVAGLAVLLAF